MYVSFRQIPTAALTLVTTSTPAQAAYSSTQWCDTILTESKNTTKMARWGHAVLWTQH